MKGDLDKIDLCPTSQEKGFMFHYDTITQEIPPLYYYMQSVKKFLQILFVVCQTLYPYQ